MRLTEFKSDREVINNKIKNNLINDIRVIHNIEQLLVFKRGYVFKMPSAGKPVIVFMSGGLDTTAVISILLSEYRVSVYPLFINRQLPHEAKIRHSINFFTNYFLKHHPLLFHKQFEMRLTLPPVEVKKVLLPQENDIIKYQNRKGIPLQPSMYANYGLFYAKYLEENLGIKCRTIIGGWLPSNSEWYGYESFQSLRSIMLNLCCIDDDFSWQFASLPMERELGFYFDKDVLIKIGNKHSLPLEKTWTCFQGKRIHCGNCPPCWTRIDAFKKAGIKDNTRYSYGLTWIQKTRKYTKKIIKWMIKPLLNLKT